MLAGLTNSSPDCGDAFMSRDPVTLSATFTNIGSLDTHRVSIDWGNGVVTTGTVVESGGNGTVRGSYVYPTGGIFTITVTLTDDDGGVSRLQTVAVVGGVGLNNGQLQVIGTDRRDVIHVSSTTGGTILKVVASF